MSTQDYYKRTKTVSATTKNTNPQSDIGHSTNSNGGGLIDLISLPLNKFPFRQNSNVVAREFVIEEDFEEDCTTPMSKCVPHSSPGIYTGNSKA